MKRGFTIIELMLVIVLISAAAGIMIPVFLRFQYKNDLDLAVNQYSVGLRRAQSLAKSGERDSNWGVSYQPGKVIVYKGTTFALRDTTLDEDYEISTGITISGLGDVNFNQVAGNPSTTGTATFLGPEGESKTVTINAKGIITY